jgi:hypothetical protein
MAVDFLELITKVINAINTSAEDPKSHRAHMRTLEITTITVFRRPNYRVCQGFRLAHPQCQIRKRIATGG